MGLEWMPREHEKKDHFRFTDQHWGTEAPCVVYEKKPLKDNKGNVVPGLYVAWVRLNNPAQFNSYTTEMVKGVIAGFENSSVDREVVGVVFTGTGPFAFCTGGNTKEYSEYYSRRPEEYGAYMELFNNMVDSILMCKKPVVCRVNGMRVAGGQEIGTACDLTLASDLSIFGQAGPRHGSAPVGGASDFLPSYMSIEDAMWSCISCEMWSAYKMVWKGLITKAFPVLKDDKGNWVRNPQVITDKFFDNGEIVYGENKAGQEFKDARAWVGDKQKAGAVDFSLMDAEIDRIMWAYANLFPGCLMKSIDGVRQKKKFFWDTNKNEHRHWLAANMGIEAFLGFGAFNTKKITGTDTIDFIGYRKGVADGVLMDDTFMEKVLGKPQK
ncbi:MAG: 1,4-Dihydroxy-2-naphthoyl-CoA synthase [Syntrophorhabdus sp. PtaB.Bin184]|jgi:6-oxo-cyclohex-1-ene-carbonyl-CoA hydrolase|nr:MAG: 1,4-Dihydroxy-2-naphthoyl-CoA synthase [Syntrophorhabdus sp. PtaB.Bin184]